MNIGKRIKELRKEKGVTLQELSKKSGVALATLSRMENGKMIGTVNSHQRICKALSVSLAELYRELEDASKTVDSVPLKERADHFVHARGAKYELLVHQTLDKKIMPLMIKVAAGGETQKEQNKPGIEKFIYMLKGSIEASVGGRKYTLKPGDSLYIDASLPHFIVNRTKTSAEAICIVSPPAL